MAKGCKEIHQLITESDAGILQKLQAAVDDWRRNLEAMEERAQRRSEESDAKRDRQAELLRTELQDLNRRLEASEQNRLRDSARMLDEVQSLKHEVTALKVQCDQERMARLVAEHVMEQLLASSAWSHGRTGPARGSSQESRHNGQNRVPEVPIEETITAK